MHQCISVYPTFINQTTVHQLKEYLILAKKYGINEVFTSIHLPEFTMEMQLAYLELVSEYACQLDMELTADIGGPFIQRALEDETVLKRLSQIKLDFLRLDYGYDETQLKLLYHSLNLKGFIINASMIDESLLIHHLSYFKSLNENIFIRACHNFYVREESGLDTEFALKQTQLFQKYDIPVFFCVPCHDHPRGPLHLGLPTLEHHRYLPMDTVILDLIYTYHSDGLLYSDEWMSEKQFQLIKEIVQNKTIQIPVILSKNLTETEKRIILKKHIFRYDSNKLLLRSRTSREMAEFASSIQPLNCTERNTGCITIDNERYLRYSGELQVVLKDLDKDERVNVAGRLKNLDDIQKLLFFRSGITYEFVEAD